MPLEERMSTEVNKVSTEVEKVSSKKLLDPTKEFSHVDVMQYQYIKNQLHFKKNKVLGIHLTKERKRKTFTFKTAKPF